MCDPRYTELARVVVGHSCALEPGEKVLIEAIDTPEAFVCELVRVAAEAGARPLVSLRRNAVLRQLLLCASREQMELWAEADALRMSRVDAYVGIHGSFNLCEMADVPPERRKLYHQIVSQQVYRDLRDPDTRWVALRWPSPPLAQKAGMSTAGFEDVLFRACTLDYARMSRAMQPLRELLARTDRIRLSAPGTDLTMSVQGFGAIACDGRHNLPDGEVFTAPVRDSVRGTIHFNTPSHYAGSAHGNVRLKVEQGRVVEARSDDTASLLRVLDTDSGARCFGELAIGCNPHLTAPMGDPLFDEKIAGSVHLALGYPPEGVDNGNRSQIHWDLVLRMQAEHGGGEVFFDDRCVMKDGRFVLDELADLDRRA